jgi:hypothetical protein
MVSLPAQADDCSEITSQYRNAQVAVIQGRLEIHLQRLVVQEGVAWSAMLSAQATLGHILQLAAIDGCKLPPMKHPNGIVDDAKDRACAAAMSKPPKRPLREVPECAHYVATAAAIREGR